MKNKLLQKAFFCLLAVGLITACNSGETSSASSTSNKENITIGKQNKSTVPTSDIVFKSIASALDSFCALDQQDKIYCWGSGGYSQLGSGTTDNNYVPTPVLNPNNVKFKKIVGFSHNFCTLDDIGNVYCWGKGANGQVGNGASTDVSSPTLITMPATIKFQSIVIGGGTTCALATNGHAYCWGQGESGQIGNGENKNQFIPTEVTMPTTNEIFTELNISYYGPAFVCGLTNLGNIYCWGYAGVGVIGDGDTSSQYKNLPTKVAMPEMVSFSHLVPGMGSTVCALDKYGMSYCWGYNSHGEIGDGSFSNKSIPTPTIMPSNENFTLVATSANSSCAATNKNNIYCWGYGANGQLGNGTIENSAVPLLTDFANHQIIKISSGYSINTTLCAIDSDKKIFCWGYGADGSIGNGKNQDTLVPTQVIFSDSSMQFTDVVISGNSKTSCALTANEGKIYCWGYGADGQNGNGIKINTNLPSLVITTPAITKLVSSSNFYSGTFCALHSNNNIYCWGYGMDGQIGNGQDQNESTPSKVQLPLNHIITELKASSSSFCGLDESGQALCWGYGIDGQLGNREFLSSNRPVTVAMPYTGAAFINLVANEESWCALDKFGMIYCWGYGAEGAIGNGKFDSVSQPTQIKLPSGVIGFKSLYADRADTICAVANTNDLYCWGNGNYGQIGNKSNSYYNVNTPTKVDGNLKFDLVVGASGTFCGINHSDYRGYCWGMGNYGQIGNQQQVNQNSPIALSDRNIASPLINIIGSDSSFCTEDMNGGIYCWGRGDLGQIGNGLMSNSNVPTPIQQPTDNLTLDFAVAASDTFCTLLTSAGVYCWGRGDLGQVGNGFSNNSSVPSKISYSNLTFANDLGKITSISAATDSFCLLNSLGHVYCWGDGFSGENGSGDYYEFKMEPTPLAFSY